MLKHKDKIWNVSFTMFLFVFLGLHVLIIKLTQKLVITSSDLERMGSIAMRLLGEMLHPADNT